MSILIYVFGMVFVGSLLVCVKIKKDAGEIRYYRTENELLLSQKESLEAEVEKLKFNAKWRQK